MYYMVNIAWYEVLLCSRASSIIIIIKCLGLFWLFLWIIPGSAPTCNLQELFMERGEFSIQFACISKTQEVSRPNERLVTAGWVEELGRHFMRKDGQQECMLALEGPAPRRRERVDSEESTRVPATSLLQPLDISTSDYCEWAEESLPCGLLRQMWAPHAVMEMIPNWGNSWGSGSWAYSERACTMNNAEHPKSCYFSNIRKTPRLTWARSWETKGPPARLGAVSEQQAVFQSGECKGAVLGCHVQRLTWMCSPICFGWQPSWPLPIAKRRCYCEISLLLRIFQHSIILNTILLYEYT